MYNIESGAQDLELGFVAYDAGSIGDLSCDVCPDVNDSFASTYGVTIVNRQEERR